MQAGIDAEFLAQRRLYEAQREEAQRQTAAYYASQSGSLTPGGIRLLCHEPRDHLCRALSPVRTTERCSDVTRARCQLCDFPSRTTATLLLPCGRTRTVGRGTFRVLSPQSSTAHIDGGDDSPSLSRNRLPFGTSVEYISFCLHSKFQEFSAEGWRDFSLISLRALSPQL